MQRRFGVVLLFAAGLMVVSGLVTPTSAHATPGPGVIHTIRNPAASWARQNSIHPQVDVCLDTDTNTLGRNGTKVQLWECNDTSQQDWYYEPVNGTDAVIKSSRAGSGYCLDADLNTMGSNGTKVQLWQCNGTTQQLWRGYGTNKISNVRAGNAFCLDADTNTISGNGTKVQLWGCNGAEQQIFPLSSPFTKICKTMNIGGPGPWQTSFNAGNGIHISVINSSLAPINISATNAGGLIYSGVLGINGSALIDTGHGGNTPVKYVIGFTVSGPSIGTVGIAVRSDVC